RLDPLWVISLRDPAHPTIAGQVHLPGWSDYIYPRGDRLVAVGRAGSGQSVGLALFDVSDPHAPLALDQITLGGWNSESEANLDDRAITFLDDVAEVPVIAIGYGGLRWFHDDASRLACQYRNYLQLVDLQPDHLVPRGHVGQLGAVRRSFFVGDK